MAMALLEVIEIGEDNAVLLSVAAPMLIMLLPALVSKALLVSRKIKFGRLVSDELPSTSAPD